MHTIGIGAGHLPPPSVLDGISLILLCGVAGGLDPSLQIGDVVLDDPEKLIPDHGLYRRGLIHTASQIVVTPEEKSRLNADTQAVAVDMEQAVVREFAAKFHIPVIGLRAISDTSQHVLNPAVLPLVDDLGKARPLKIATLLIRRPDLIPYLKQLGANTSLATRQLGQAAVAVVDGLCSTLGEEKGTNADFAETSE